MFELHGGVKPNEDTARIRAYNWKPRIEKNAFKVLFMMYHTDCAVQVPVVFVFLGDLTLLLKDAEQILRYIFGLHYNIYNLKKQFIGPYSAQ